MNKTLVQKLSPIAIAVAALALSGCAVTTRDVSKAVRDGKGEIEAAQAQAPTQAMPKPGLRLMQGNFLGARTMQTSNATRLPAHLRSVVLGFGPSSGTIYQAAANITQVTGLPVRVSPDVGTTYFVLKPEEAPTAGSVPLPGPLPEMAPEAAPAAPRSTGPIPLSFTGDLSDYLNLIASAMNANWVYENGEVTFYKMLTRRLQLAVSPGTLAYRDDVSSGGSGGGGESNGSSFASSASATVEAQLSPWQGIEDAIKTMLSPEGKAHINQASAAIVITDLKANVDRITRYIEAENDLLTRQVRIEMREILVEESGSASAGIDVSIIYNRLLESGLNVDGLSAVAKPNYNIATTAPATLVDAASGTMKVNFAREGYFQGSSIVAQALNGIGKVVSNSSRTIITTNRVPGRVQDVTDRAYLAKTEPGTGGVDGGGGVPGLTPGLVTYGDNITVVPTVRDNGEVLMQLFSTRSSLIELNSVSAGEGATFQQINTPVLNRKKFSQNFRVRDGETLIIVSNVSNSLGSKDRQGITGASTTANRSKVMSVLMVTPRVQGI